MTKLDLVALGGLRRLATIPWTRSAAAGLASLFRNEEAPEPAGCFPGLTIDEPSDAVVSELRRSGYCTGLRIDADTLGRIHEACAHATFVEDVTARRFDFEAARASTSSNAFRWLNPHRQDEFIDRLVRDDRILTIARQYLGVDPILHSSQIWLLHPPAESHAKGAEYGWHYDIDDFRFLKLFIYLTDPCETRGEHMLVRASHHDRRSQRLKNRRMADEAIRSLYPAEDILVMAGEAGTAFFEDTWLYHRATPPSADRMMMQIEFCSTGVMKRLERRIYGR